MDPFSARPDIDREAAIQKRIMARLRRDGWFVKATHGNSFQCGFPDLFACHVRYGSRWIETKRPDYQSFTEAQLRDFPLLSNNGAGIWVLTGEDDSEIRKLFLYQNWYQYLQVSKVRTRYRSKVIKEPKQSRTPSHGPEWQVQEATRAVLEAAGWIVKNTHGNIYQYGFPDQFVTHKKYGQRWIEYKTEGAYRFTPAQIDVFPQFQANGCGVWILTDPGQTGLLFKPGNWRDFLK